MSKQPNFNDFAAQAREILMELEGDSNPKSFTMNIKASEALDALVALHEAALRQAEAIARADELEQACDHMISIDNWDYVNKRLASLRSDHQANTA